MAKFLLAWELGRGSGHLVRMLPIIDELLQRGHQVYAAVKDIARAKEILPVGKIDLTRAPVLDKPIKEIQPALTFAHVLHNVGFNDVGELRQRVNEWLHIYRQIQPDVIIFDHSPTALLASRAIQTRRVLLGSGFFCPPDCSPLPNLRPWIKAAMPQVLADEQRVLQLMNTILNELQLPPLDRITQLYSEADKTCLTTFKELDHYRERTDARYWGAWTKAPGGEIPQWPAVEGKKIYAYLKPFPGLSDLLALLAELNQSTIISCDGIDPSIQRRFQSPNIRFSNHRLDLERVGQECDLGILNGNHGTTISLLLAGKPSFHVPITLEQAMLADAVRRMGAGLAASFDRPAEVNQRLRRMLLTTAFQESAINFQQRYATFQPQQSQAEMVSEIERLAIA